MDKLLKAIGVLVLLAVGFFFRLFVSTKVWALIAVKHFGLQPIGLWQAFAISYLLATLTVDTHSASEKEAESIGIRGVSRIIVYAFSWFLAYLLFS